MVLPAVTFAEKSGTFTNAERRIQRVRPGVTSPGEAMSDFEIFQKLSAALGGSLSYTGPEAVFGEITRDLPAYAGIELEAIGPQGAVWGGDLLAIDKKQLVAVQGPEKLEAPLQLVTGSALYHSGTISTRAKGPRAVIDEAYVELSRDDAAALKIEEGDKVTVKAGEASVTLPAKVDIRLPKGVLFVPYHFAEVGLNRLYKGEAAVGVDISK